MSDTIPTPRTDAELAATDQPDYNHVDRFVIADFARQLERELAVAMDALENIAYQWHRPIDADIVLHTVNSMRRAYEEKR